MNRSLVEKEKYDLSYTDPNYKMGQARKNSAKKCIDWVLDRTGIETHLDTSAGRGEIVDFMRSKNINSIGTEIVDSLLVPDKILFAWSNDLPFDDNSFDFLTNLDAMEHYLPEQTEEIIEEFCRVTKKYIYFAISNTNSFHKGNDLHINKKPYEEWFEILSKYGKVEWLYKKDNLVFWEKLPHSHQPELLNPCWILKTILLSVSSPIHLKYH